MCSLFTRSEVLACALALAWWAVPAVAGAEVLRPVDERFSEPDVQEQPSFQRHVIPLLGRMGCNGRACHGSFQGQGGFQLSLFGYDFVADHQALLDGDQPRVDRQQPADSLILHKPTSEDEHEGGQRFEVASWQYHLLHRWIELGAAFDRRRIETLSRLEVHPSEILFERPGQQVTLQAIAVWEDGSREDVTPLCRFQTNDDQVATVSDQGLVTAADPGDTHVVVFYDKAVVPVPVLRPVTELVGDGYPPVDTPTRIDELVVEKLRKLGIVPSELCSDAEFLRRLRLDLTGSLPTPEEVEAFLADGSPDKRGRKIDELLQTPSYAAWWTTRLCDFTGNNDAALQNASPARGRPGQDWYDWIYKRVAENVPYDQLVEGIVLATSRDPGESYTEYSQYMSQTVRGERDFADRHYMPYYWARRDVRQPQERAISFAYSFLGVRIECAQCHKHPFDQWSKEDFDQFTGFFSRVVAANRPSRQSQREYDELLADLGVEMGRGNNNQVRLQFAQMLREGKTVPFPEVYAVPSRGGFAGRGRPGRGRGRASDTGRLLGREQIDLNRQQDPRRPLMQWLRDQDNPYFARALVNRVWAGYFHAGIVEPTDDLSLANPPSNGPLLDWLTESFVRSGYDMKWLHREITHSRTYQLSWQPNPSNLGDQRNFSRAIPRRLPAEVVYDSLQLATASDDQLESLHGELRGRAIALAGSGRARGRGGPQYALAVFGRSTRETNCDCDRSSEASLLQTVFLQNDQEVLGMLDRRDGWLNQVARQWNLTPLAADRPLARGRGGRPGNFNQLAAMRARLRRLRAAGETEQAERLQQRLAQLQRQAGQDRPARPAPQRPAPAPSQDRQLDPEDLMKLVDQAYLRTLSRYPDEQEKRRSGQYLEQADSPLHGLRDLMWALLNTKEFIVNH